MSFTPTPPPPYTNMTGLTKVMDNHINVDIANYDGVAKQGELIVDLQTLNLYVGDANGNLVSLANAGGGGGGNGTNYSNANVVAYAESGFAGNIIPGTDSAYSLGSASYQWKDLWVNGATIYMNTIPLHLDANSDLNFNNKPLVTADPGTGMVNVPALVVAGDVTAGRFIGDGGLLTNISVNYSNANVANYLPIYTGDLTVSNANVTGTLIANVLQINGNIAANNISGNTASITGNVNAGNLIGNVYGNFAAPGANGEVLFNDNGWISAGPAMTYDKNTPTLTVANLNTGTNAMFMSGNSIRTSNNTIIIDPLADGTQAGNLVVLANLQVAGNVTYVSSNTTTIDNLVWQAANNANTPLLAAGGGLAVGPNSAPYATWLYDPVSNAWRSNISIITAGGIQVNGALSNATSGAFSGNIIAGNISSVGNVTANLFVGNGSLLSNISGPNVVGAVPLANTANTAATVTSNAQPNITSVGTLTSLSVSGNTQSGNLLTNGVVSAAGNVIGQAFVGGNANIAGNVYAASLVGNFVGNYTAPGTNTQVMFNDTGLIAGDAGLTFNKLSNTLNVSNVSFGAANIQIGNNLIRSSNSNIIIDPQGDGGMAGNVVILGSLSVAGNVTYLNTSTTTSNNLVWAAAANATTVFQAAGGGLTVGPNAAPYATWLYDAALNAWRSNIDIIGAGNATFTGAVTASGNVQGGNLVTPGNISGAYIFGNGAHLTGLPAGYANANASAFFASGNANANIITTAQISATGANLGNIANVKITGGANGQVVTTDGAGNLSFASVSPPIAAIPAVYFTAATTGNNQTFSNVNLLSYPSAANLTVFYNGVLLENTYYSLAGGTLTVDTWLNAGDTIDIPTQYAGNTGVITNSGYSNANVADYLPVYSGNVSAAYYTGNGAFLTGLPAGYSNADVVAYAQAFAGNIIPATSNVYSLGSATNQWKELWVKGNTIYLDSFPLHLGANNQLHFDNNPLVTANASTGVTNVPNLVVPGNVAILGNLSVAGNVVYQDVDSSYTANLQWIAAYNANTALAANSAGLAVGPAGSAYAQFVYSAVANTWVASLPVTAPAFSTTGNITAGAFYGDGGHLSNISGNAIVGGPYGNANLANVGSNAIGTTGNITGGNLAFTGTLTSNTATLYHNSGLDVWYSNKGMALNGTLWMSAGITGATDGSFSGMLSSNVAWANTAFINEVRGNYLYGEGGNISNIQTSRISNATSNVTIASANGNVQINVAGNTVMTVTANTLTAPLTYDGGNVANVCYYNAATKEVTYAAPISAAASYAKFTRTTTQTITAGGANQPVICNVTEATMGGDIAYDALTGILTLQPGRTYRLTASVGVALQASGGVRGVYQWKNLTTGVFVGENGMQVSPSDNMNNGPAGSLATYTFTAAAVTQMQLILTANNNITGLGTVYSVTERGYPWIECEVIAANAPFTPNLPISMVTRREITKIANYGYNNTLFIADNRLWCIKGYNNDNYNYAYTCGQQNPTAFQGMLGPNNAYEIVIPEEVTGTLIDAGIYGEAAYALFNNGNLYTWGSSDDGGLGPAVTNITDRWYPELSLTNVATVYTHPSNAASEPHTQRLIVKKTDGTVWGCGYNGFGELGLGNTTSTIGWTQMTWAGTNPISVWNLGSYAGATVVQKSDGTIWVCGYNGAGQLGIGNYTTAISTPVNATAAWTGGDTTMRIKSMHVGTRYYDGNWQGYWMMAMLLDNGTASRYASAGNNNWGSFGNGNFTNANTPQTPTGLTGRISKISSPGCSPMTVYALMTNGDLWTWGYNAFGQVGNNSTTNSNVPYRVFTGVAADLLTDVQGWAFWGYYSQSPLVKKTDGTYWMWGYGANGQLGDGGQSNQWVPSQVRLPQGVNIKMAGALAGNDNGLGFIAISDTNEIYAWGYNGTCNIDSTNSSDNICVPVRFVPPNMLTW